MKTNEMSDFYQTGVVATFHRLSAIPDIFDKIKEAVEEDNK
jgi:hypothetical protein